MPDQYDLGNIASFIGGFAGQREKIAAANQEDKNYKLQTVQTLFQFAEGKRAQAEASRLLAGDEKLSRNERDRHQLDVDRHSAEGEKLYAGASELFGLIDDKPKTGKKPNPAMQFLQFVNPFKRRGPGSGGEFETELSELLSGLGGGKGGGGAGAESPGFTLGGIGGVTPQGQGAADPEQTPVSAALGAAIPGVGPTPKLAGGPVSPAAAVLAQQRPVGTATGEALEAGVAPAGVAPVTGITPTPERGPLLDQRVISSRELYPHITGTRNAYKDLSLTDYNERINQEGQEALANLNAQIQSTKVRETFTDAMNDPNFTKHYRPAARAFQNLGQESFEIFQSNIAAIFPEMRERPPEAGSALLADVARQLRLEQAGGKFADASTWTDATIAAIEALDVWMTMQPDLGPLFVVMRRYIATTRKDSESWTDADRYNVEQFKDFYDRGMFGPGTGPDRAAAPNYSFFKGISPDGRGEIWYYRDPANPQAGATPLLGAGGGSMIGTQGPLQLDDIMISTEWTLDPDTGSMERKGWKVDTRKTIAALSKPGSRRQIQEWITTKIFVPGSPELRDIQQYLDDNPTAGLGFGETGPGPGSPDPGARPQLGGSALDAFRKRRGGEAEPPPPSPFGR